MLSDLRQVKTDLNFKQMLTNMLICEKLLCNVLGNMLNMFPSAKQKTRHMLRELRTFMHKTMTNWCVLKIDFFFKVCTVKSLEIPLVLDFRILRSPFATNLHILCAVFNWRHRSLNAFFFNQAPRSWSFLEKSQSLFIGQNFKNWKSKDFKPC